MADKIIFSQPYGSIFVDASVPCLMVQWHGFANAANFIALQEAVLAYLEAHATSARPWGLVGDTRRMGAIPLKVQAWLIEEFNPRIVATGLRELSVVLSENIFGQLATQRYVQEANQARDRYVLHTAYYDSVEAAKAGARAALAAR